MYFSLGNAFSLNFILNIIFYNDALKSNVPVKILHIRPRFHKPSNKLNTRAENKTLIESLGAFKTR